MIPDPGPDQGSSQGTNLAICGDMPTSPPRPSKPIAVLTSTERSGKTGPELIREYLKHLPSTPGVYRMLNAQDTVIYVGKAKSLKNRVGNYARGIGHNSRVTKMIAETAAMEFVVTKTETEALLLEANLIKKHKPHYNTLLRDDKSFPHILIRRDHDAPQVLKHRGARRTKGDYFGPFASAGAVNRTLTTLQKAFLLRSCSDSVYENRTRACMLHQIKRCAAPCVGEISSEAYGELVDDAAAFLSGKSDALRTRLQQEMEVAAEALEFERAASLRNRIRALAPITTSQTINPAGVSEADVIAIHKEGPNSCVQVFFFRAGQHWGDQSYFPRHTADITAEEVLEAFLGQFYVNKDIPRQIFTSHTPTNAGLLSDALSLQAERKIALHCPERGEKRRLVDDAARNAHEALSRKLSESASQARLMTAVAQTFDLASPPQRIEVYDNSHIQGTKAVGAMVVAGPEGFDKRAYRTWNFSADDVAPGDDYAMMRDVLRRRFSRLMKETADPASDGETSQHWPDLVVIDGGAGQLSAVLDVYADVGLEPETVPLVAIAKGPDRNAGREQFFMPGRAAFQLPSTSPVLYYLQRLRDEAHRFAIGAHRAKRSKSITHNPLDDIPGVGPARKRALLEHFGSARSVQRASLSDLEKAPGVSKKLARSIHDWFQS